MEQCQKLLVYLLTFGSKKKGPKISGLDLVSRWVYLVHFSNFLPFYLLGWPFVKPPPWLPALATFGLGAIPFRPYLSGFTSFKVPKFSSAKRVKGHLRLAPWFGPNSFWGGQDSLKVLVLLPKISQPGKNGGTLLGVLHLEGPLNPGPPFKESFSHLVGFPGTLPEMTHFGPQSPANFPRERVDPLVL